MKLTRPAMAQTVEALALLLPEGNSPQCKAIADHLRESCATCEHAISDASSSHWCDEWKRDTVATGHCHYYTKEENPS